MRKLLLALAILPFVSFAQQLPIPNPYATNRPDSSFNSIIMESGQAEVKIENRVIKNARILLSDIQNLSLKNLELIDCDVRIAGCPDHTATNIKIRGGSWNVFPTPIPREWMYNWPSWYSATNFTWIGGSHAATFKSGGGLQTLTFPIAQLKNGKDALPYALAKWKFRDSAGKVVTPVLWDWKQVGENIVARFQAPEMASGSGFWSCVDPNGFVKGIKYTGIDADRMEYFAVYFADGISVTNSAFGPATLDYNLGFEHCANVNLKNVESRGNRTKQGNGADVAFLAGIRGLSVKDCEIGTLAVTSSGWEVSDVVSDIKIGWLDKSTGWIGKVLEQGVLNESNVVIKI
jgi:hypothetical protein